VSVFVQSLFLEFLASFAERKKQYTMVASAFLAATALLAGAFHAAALPPGSQFRRPGFPASFDYVVVGGGTAGLAVVHRLAEDGTCSVAVIEAGGFYEQDNGNLSTVPAFTSSFVDKNPTAKNPLIDWRQRTTPQTICIDISDSIICVARCHVN
jgi:choline dehydrogenase